MSHPSEAVGVLYRRTLIELDQTRAQLAASGALCPTVVAALDVYRSTVQESLHAQEVSP